MTIADVSARARWTLFVTLLRGALLFLTPLASLATGTATLVWNPSPGTNVIADYRIYYGVASGTYTSTISAGTATTLTISNLVQGATYFFGATAIDIFGLESDYSSEASALIPVDNPNRPPTLDPLVNLAFDENVGPQTVALSGITSGATNEAQTLTVTASSANTALIPAPAVSYASPNTSGSLTFTPNLFTHGTATITVTVNDGGASNNLVSRAFDVTIQPVNHAPTLGALANLTINENAGYQTVNLTGIGSGAPDEDDSLVITAASSNPSLIPDPTVTYTSPNTTGSLTFLPLVFVHGSATITVTVNDGGASNNIVTRAFTVTVNPVNQPPTLDALADRTINENAGLQTVSLSGIGSGAASENDTLVVTASSSNPGLIPAPAVSYNSPATTGSISFAPVTNAYGSATITVTVNDGAASNNIVSRAFHVTVNEVTPRPAPCSYALDLSPASFSANATLGTITVAAGDDCAWSVVAPAWISLSLTNGTGAQTGSFSVEPNTGAGRAGLVTLTGTDTNISCIITQQAPGVGAVALAAPLDGDTLPTSLPQFAWSQSPLAVTKYQLVLNRDGGPYLTEWITDVTNWTASTSLPAGNYTWNVETWTETGQGPTSTNSSFTVPAGLPGMVTLISPNGTAALNGTQRFTWTADPAATRYELRIERDGNLFFNRWFTMAESLADSATGRLSVDLTGIGAGTYFWWVRGSGAGGDGPWSDRMRVFLSRAP